MSAVPGRLRKLGGIRGADLRAARWASSALTAVRADLVTDGVAARVADPPAGLPKQSVWIVRTVLNKRRATCLERSLVVQRWLAAHGELVPVSIGVGDKNRQFSAHAWLPGVDPKRERVGYAEIRRLEP